MLGTFLYSLAGGMAVVLALGQPSQVAWKFLRFCGLLIFTVTFGTVVWTARSSGISVIADFPTPLWLSLALCVAAIVGVLLAPFAAQNSLPFRVVVLVGGMAGVAAACWSLTDLVANLLPLERKRWVLLCVGQVLGSLLLGSVTVSWLLGHAYLTATRMTIAPLKRFSRLLNVAVAMRVFFFVVSVSMAVFLGYGEDGSVWARLIDLWLIASLRVLTGLLLVAMFAYMVSDCVRLRSTQSATGLLYFGSVLAYVGELASLKLTLVCGWAL